MLDEREVILFLNDNSNSSLCDTCAFDCSSQSTPPRITSAYGRTIKCQDYMTDGELKEVRELENTTRN